MVSVCYPSSLGCGEVTTCFWGKDVRRGMPHGSLAPLSLEQLRGHNHQRTQDLCQGAPPIYVKHLLRHSPPTFSSRVNKTFRRCLVRGSLPGDEWGDLVDTALAFKWLRLSKEEDGHANEPCKDNRTGRHSE